MRYPNQRYGDPNALRYYMLGMTVKEMAKRLKRSERSIQNYLTYRTKMPWWIPELLRLQRMEHAERTRQMHMTPIIKRYNLRTAEIVNFRIKKKESPITGQNESVQPVKLRA